MKKNDIVLGKCIDYDYQGNGVVKIDGFVVFVKGLIVGEVAQIKIIKVLKNSSIGIISELVETSTHRVTPMCNSYRTCGGCALMHMDLDEQQRFKTQYVQTCFDQAKLDIHVNPIIASRNPTYYRNKVQIPLQYDNGWHYGFYRNHSHDLVEFETCYIQADFANTFVPRFVEVLNNSGLTEGIRHLVLKMMGNQTMVIVVASCNLPQSLLDDFIALAKEFNVTSLVINHHPDNSNTVLSYDNTVIYGPSFIDASCLGLTYHVSANSFYQVNSIMMEVLYQTAYDYMQAKDNECILDLYCGTGTIGLGVAKTVKQLIGVDVVESSIANAKTNAKDNGIDNATFYCMDAGKAASWMVHENMQFDGIFVDPPRKGCDEVTIEALKTFNTKRIVYISCNPSTLARDCARLASCYDVVSITPVDMFAHSYHVETVALLKHKDMS